MTYRTQIGTLADLSPLDVHELYKLRVDVFVHEQQVPYAEIDDIDASQDNVHFLLWEDAPLADAQSSSTLAGTLRVYPSDVPVETVAYGSAQVTANVAVHQIGRFCFAPDYRATGAARALLEEAMEYCAKQDPTKPLYLTAQKPLVPYYEKYGFQSCGEEYDDEGQPHQPMIRKAR